MKSSESLGELVEVLRESLDGYGCTRQIISALKSFLGSPYGSLIVVNAAGEIQFMDHRSESLFGLKHGSSKGLLLTDIIPRSHFPKVLEKGIPEVGRVLFLGQKYSIGTILPLIENGVVIGAMGYVLFDSAEEFLRLAKEAEQVMASSEAAAALRENPHSLMTYSFKDILGVGRGIRDAIRIAKKAAYLGLDLLISGESGTGKELFAQSIHNYAKPGGPFIRINSPSIPAELAESELFGYEKGAFSGARSSGKPGKFELAEGGTVFIDEISSMPLSIQGKLLWVLQEREFERVGGTGVKRLQARVICATNMDLPKLAERGAFREDLYFRISNLVLRIPPLRERTEDIPVYIHHYLREINDRFGTGFESPSPEALTWCMQYEWPGNVRELKASLEHAALSQWHGKEIPLACFPQHTASHQPNRGRGPGDGGKKEIRRLIAETLVKTNGNKRRAAQILGISRATLYKRIAEHGITGF